jgi:protein SCO1
MMNTKRVLLKAAMSSVALHPILVLAKPQTPGPRADYFPNAILQTHEGKNVRFYDDVVKGGKVVVINMMYTSCTNICPPNTANLMRVQEMLGDRICRDIFMYSLTLQPEMDTPEALRAYVKLYGIKPGWTFLTGKHNDIELIRRRLGFFDRDAERDATLSEHTGMVRMGREAFDRWTMMPGLAKPKQLVNSILRF